MYRNFLIYLCASALWAQASGDSVTEGMQKEIRELFELNRYDRAVGILTRASTEYPDDNKVLSLLGTAYLCSASSPGNGGNVEKAGATMEKAVETGGNAVFLVSRAKPQKKLTRGPSILDAAPGELRISRNRLSFVPTREKDQGASFAREDLKECGLNSGWGKDSNAFHIKTVKETLDFRPLHFSKEEAGLACSLAAKFLGVKYVK